MSLIPIVHGGHSNTAPFTVATGGTITTDGDYKVHTFNSSGTFSVSNVGILYPDVEYLIIAGGGGGIPSYNTKKGSLRGLDGVVDKDKTAALIGRIIRAKEYFIITDVDNIFLNYNRPNQKKLVKITATETKKYLDDGHFGIGSMETNIKSALYFLKHHGEIVVITSIDKIEQAIKGKAGTQILRD